MIYILKSDNDPITEEYELLHNVCLLSLLQIRFHNFTIENTKSFDYILLTSKNAIKAILRLDFFKSLLNIPAIVIGESTQNLWLKEGGKIAFCPKDSFSGKEFAQIIRPIVKNKKVLYIHGEDKAIDFAQILKNDCDITERVAYKNIINENARLHMPYNNKILESKLENQNNVLQNEFEDESIFIFGSPKHYKTFLRYYGWNPTWLAISLGDTTFETFDENIRKLNARGSFEKALKVAQAMCNTTPIQDFLLIKTEK